MLRVSKRYLRKKKAFEEEPIHLVKVHRVPKQEKEEKEDEQTNIVEENKNERETNFIGYPNKIRF